MYFFNYEIKRCELSIKESKEIINLNKKENPTKENNSFNSDLLNEKNKKKENITSPGGTEIKIEPKGEQKKLEYPNQIIL